MPRDKLYGERFKVQKWKWYLVDLRDFHHPVLVRKHLDSKLQAIQFKEKYYDKHYDIIDYRTALKYGLRDYINQLRRHKHHTGKYPYPEGCTTQYQRQLFRNNYRKKQRQKMRRPRLTETVVWEILDDKPVRFVHRLKQFNDNHWVYSEPVEGLKAFEKKYQWPSEMRHLCNIVRTLNKYYDIGPYDMVEVAIFIYKKWGPRIRKYGGKVTNNPRNEEKVTKELKARGFVYLSTLNFDLDDDSFVETIYLLPVLAHPEQCSLTADETKLYDHNIYDFQAKVGIPGYTRAHVPKKMTAKLARVKGRRT